MKSKIDFNESLRLLTAQRILDPQSKWKSVQSQRDLFGDFNLSPQDVYRSLDHFSLLSEQIQLQIHNAIKENVGRTGALVFYDVTNYYFKTDLDDEPLEVDGETIPAFRKRGPARKNGQTRLSRWACSWILMAFRLPFGCFRETA